MRPQRSDEGPEIDYRGHARRLLREAAQLAAVIASLVLIVRDGVTKKRPLDVITPVNPKNRPL